jgi:hypothetical protein
MISDAVAVNFVLPLTTGVALALWGDSTGVLGFGVVGLVAMWMAIVGITTQFFINMEIERYTLATGETAVAGFARYWKPFGILFCFLAVFPFVFPGWATSAVTIASFLGLWGEGAVPIVSIIVLLAMGIALTISPVSYVAPFREVGIVLGVVTPLSTVGWFLGWVPGIVPLLGGAASLVLHGNYAPGWRMLTEAPG